MSESEKRQTDLVPGLRPVQRMRLTQRVLAQLAEVAPDTYVEADTEASPLESLSLRVTGDLLLVALNVRVRISLLPSEWLSSLNSLVPDAHELMSFYPDTDAVALVVGDDQLTTVLIEPFDRFDAIRVPTGGRLVPRISMSGGPGPVRDVVQEYLKDTAPQWESVGALTIASDQPGSEDFVRIAASDSTREAKATKYRVRQKQLARDSISSSDEDFAAQVALDVLQNRVDARTIVLQREDAT